MAIALNKDDAEMQDVWEKLQTVKDPGDREFLLVRLAEYASRLHDYTDIDLGDDIHDQFEQLREAQEHYHLQALRVGRFVARMLDSSQILLGPPEGEGGGGRSTN